MQRIALAWVALFLLWSGSALAAERIVVWNMEKGKGVDDETMTTVSSFVTGQVQRYSGRDIISEADIRTILRGEETKQSCGNADASCIAEIGAALGASEAVSGDLGRLGSYWVVNLRLIAVREVKVANRVSKTIKGDTDALIESLPAAVAELFGQVASPATKTPAPTPAPPVAEKAKPKATQPEAGKLDIATTPKGARAFLNGVDLGETPLKMEGPVGDYTLEVKLEGYKPVTQSLQVKAKETTRLIVTLEKD